jgi:hypothetical protein
MKRNKNEDILVIFKVNGFNKKVPNGWGTLQKKLKVRRFKLKVFKNFGEVNSNRVKVQENFVKFSLINILIVIGVVFHFSLVIYIYIYIYTKCKLYEDA